MKYNPRQMIEEIRKHALFLRQWIDHDPSGAERLLQNCSGTPPDRDSELVMLEERAPYGLTEKEFLSFLRGYKRAEYLKICARELSNEKLENITAHLTVAAQVTLELSLRYSLSSAARLYGLDEYPDRLCVIGLGKLGGRELNFSSDIDILFVYDSNGEEIISDTSRELTIHEFYCDVARKVSELMSTVTEDGMVFRVDQRLRPDGERGALALSVDGYAFYYESYGQTWERMMLLKSSWAAGSKNAAVRFTEAVKPFVYRRSLDRAFIEEMVQVLKRAQGRAKARYKEAKNVKLGTGGLREIEFFVQILQIMNYSKYKITTPNTLEALGSLRERDVIGKEECDILEGAYRFYRNLEHKAQMENEAQTYTVPEDSPNYPLYLERCGYSSDEQFQKEYAVRSLSVSAIFSAFTGGDGDELTAGEVLFDNVYDAAEVEGILRRWNVAEPEKCTKILYHALYGQISNYRSSSESGILKELFGEVIKRGAVFPNIALVLSAYQRLLIHHTAMYMLCEMYLSNPEIIDRLNRIFAASSYLTDIILNNNGVLEHFFYTEPPKVTQEGFRGQLREELPPPGEDPEEEYDRIRIIHKDALFSVGYPFLNGDLDVTGVMASLTGIARAVTDIAFSRTFETLVLRYGTPRTKEGAISDYVVIAMGKLGSGEMSFASDLDLIVLYEDDGAADGVNSLTNGEFYHKLVQRVHAYLSAVTAHGYLYQIDMNLRPSGASGALVTTVPSYAWYQKNNAMTWEKQALLKAKAICGKGELIERFENIRREALSVVAPGLEKDIYDMRRRLDKEKGRNPLDMKFAPGGFTDIEFAVQMLCLRNGETERNTKAALDILLEKELITRRNYDVLGKGYLFYRRVENVMRLHENRPSTRIPSGGALLSQLASVLGYQSPEQLLADYNAHRRAVRGAFERVFSKG